MLGYSTLDKSMNGVKTLTDGISIISDGIAQHENIIYNDYIKSEDGQTEIINDTVTTININAQNITGENINSDDLNTNILNCNYLYVNDISNPLQDVMEVNGDIKKLKINGTTDFRNIVNFIDTNFLQTQTGYIHQTGINFNTLKDTKFNGYIQVGSNITQTGGSTSLKDLTVDNITQNTNKGITQSGTSVSNNLAGITTIKNLTILDSVTFPSNVTIPGTTTNDDIIMQDDSVITQDITTTTTKFNLLRNTKTLNLDIDGNLIMTKAGSSATLKNSIIQGSTTLQGDIEQTAGFTKLNTIESNNITLRENNDINLSGTGKINQIGTGNNLMNGITLNNNQNIIFNGSGIISQALNGTNILSHFRGAGFGIIGGRNNTTYSHYQNIQNNNGLQFQYNRDNSSFYSYILNNKVGTNGGFRFQRYNGGVYVDEPLIIDDNITINKDVAIVGKSISASSATLGIISQTELDCLDNCNINILTKFNNLDSQISNLQNTAGNVTSATTGITYNNSNDSTTIDNNLIISSGKTMTLDSTNVNSFINNTNTFITAASNTLQGINYTSGDDTTTINNNVNITGNLIIQGMNVKAEIDALETSFTTGTLTGTTINTGVLNVGNQINMTNPTVSNRYIYNLGGLTFSDWSDNSYAMQMYNAGTNHFFISEKNNCAFSFLGRNNVGVGTDNKFNILPNVEGGAYNLTTQNDDVLLLGSGAGADTQNLNITVWSSTATGLRIQPTRTTITGGNNKLYVDNNEGVIIQGSNININNNSSSFDVDVSINKNLVVNDTFDNKEAMFTRQNLFDNVFLTEKIGSMLNNSNNSSGSGSSSQIVMTFSISPYFNKMVHLTIPISVTRTFKNISTIGLTGNNFTDKITNISYVIYKNNEVWQGGNCISSESLPREVYLSCTAKTSNMTYEIYMTNASLSFYPLYSTTTNDYKIEYTINYSYTVGQISNFIGVTYAYLYNTNVNQAALTNVNIITDPITGQLVIGPYGTTYINGSYTLTKDSINYHNGGGEIWTNDIISNSIRNQNNITTNSLFCNGNFRANTGIAGYHIDGASNFLPTPVFCSLKSFGRANTENSWYINPGFKIDIYNSNDYVSFIKSMDNTNGVIGSLFVLTDGERDRTESFKIFYLGTEISIPTLSY